MKFDICLMNPPYAISGNNIHLKFVDRINDICNKQVSIFPISLVKNHGIKSQDIYKEKYIEFDAKETRSKTSYPLSNIHSHQLEHIKNVLYFKGIVFVIVRFVMLDKTYLVMGNDLINYINDIERKSIPLSFFEEYGHLLTLKYTPRLDYLSIIDKILTNN